MIAAEGIPEGFRPASPEGSLREVWEPLSLGTPASSSDKRKGPLIFRSAGLLKPGSVLLSHCLTAAVSSALEGLTSVFGMGTGVAPPVRPPGTVFRETGETSTARETRPAFHARPAILAGFRPCLSGAKMMMLNRTTD